MTGKELKLLFIINGLKSYDIANMCGFSHTTMTRLCEPTAQVDSKRLPAILKTMETVKGEPLVTAVDLSRCIPQMDARQ